MTSVSPAQGRRTSELVSTIPRVRRLEPRELEEDRFSGIATEEGA